MIDIKKRRETAFKKPYLGKKIIFCEGKTEYNYFEHFKIKLDNKRNKYIQFDIEPIDIEGGGANSIFNKTIAFLENPNNFKYHHYDKIIVFDLDNPERQELMTNVLIKINKSSYNFTQLYSYKTFEVWLLMHLIDVYAPHSKKQLKEKLREGLGLTKYFKNSKGTIAKLVSDDENIKNAIKNAKKLENSYSEKNLNIISNYKEMNPFSNVYKLMEEILDNLE